MGDDMAFRNLNFLLLNSSSSREYYNGLDCKICSKLQERRDSIHTLAELRTHAEYLMRHGG